MTTVLIVDDDDGIRESLADVLGDLGYDVVTAPHGKAAIDLLRTGTKPGVILLDLMMPVMDGWAFREAQQKDASIKDIPVVVITAGDTSDFGQLVTLRKPLKLDAVMRALAEATAA